VVCGGHDRGQARRVQSRFRGLRRVTSKISMRVAVRVAVHGWWRTQRRREGSHHRIAHVAVFGPVGTVVPSDWKVVLGYRAAIPVWSACRVDADTGSRPDGRVMVMKPNNPGALVLSRRGPS
jgi:hypothetical protein